MKVAISGKGGVGKTTLAGVMSRLLADQGYKVLSLTLIRTQISQVPLA